MKFNKITSILFGASAIFSAAAMAEVHEVKAVGVAFQPLVVKMQSGDQVSWSNMAGHNVNTEFTSADDVTEYIPD